MEIIVRDERIPKNCYECSYLNYCSLNPDFKPTVSKCPLKPLSQHDAEVRAEERKKVVAELQEWNDKLIDEGYIIDYEDLQQKLTEIKERK